jgi:hypothetical protein
MTFSDPEQQEPEQQQASFRPPREAIPPYDSRTISFNLDSLSI